jgi:hypothetical protein
VHGDAAEAKHPSLREATQRGHLSFSYTKEHRELRRKAQKPETLIQPGDNTDSTLSVIPAKAGIQIFPSMTIQAIR